jgi:16S rRNA (guanine966-N2)-methyltransferase
MRVIAGKAKGRALQPVPGTGTRPVTDRVKESLFNILSGDIVDATFLDLFAGTGGIGIEALSRGAARAVFVEKNRRAVEVIRRNLAATGLVEGGEVRAADVFSFLHHPPSEGFDFVYVAPPQYEGLWLQTLQALDAQPAWLAPEGEIIVQIFPKELTPFELAAFSPVDERRYGSTLLLFLARREDIA